MISLKELAKQLFENFAFRETGRKADWKYLSKDRQKYWIEDANLFYHKVLEELEKDVRPVAILQSKHNGSYSLGYHAGLREERVMVITKIQKYKKDLINEYEAFMED